MRWEKIVLIFQAIMTLMIRVVFFSQLMVIDKVQLTNIKNEVTSGENFIGGLPPTIIDIKHRFNVASYLLFVISVIEILIISRFVR